MEPAVGKVFLNVNFFFCIMFIFSLVIYMTQFIQTIDFKHYVDGQIEKNGGFTDTAKANIDEYSDKHYGGRYRVESLSGNDKKPFGTQINYQIKGEIQILFFNLPDQLVTTRGSTVSQVR